MRTMHRGMISLAAIAILSVAAAAQQAPPPVRLTLRRAVELAVANSRDLQLAKLQATLATTNASVDRSQFRPNLFTGTGYEYTSGFPLAPGGGVPTIFELVYNQELYDPVALGRLHADEAVAKGTANSVDSIRETVIANTASAYLELAEMRHSLELLRGERDSAQKLIDLTHERVAAGYELPVDESKAELTVAQIEQKIAHDEGRQDALENQLRDMLGLAVGQQLDLAAEDLPQTAEQPVSDLISQAIANSADVKKADANVEAKQDVLKGARSSRWPTVSIVGNYSILTNMNNFSTYFSKFSRNNFDVGVQASLPIYSARHSASVSAAQSDVNVAALQAQNARSQVGLKVRSEVYDVRELEAGATVARIELKIAQQDLQTVQSKFDQGQTTLRELEQAHLDENDKWLAFLDADFQRQHAELTLLQETGQVSKILQ
jgi:outer membrane protein